MTNAPRTLRIGTRRSKLALAQAGLVASDLARRAGAATELVEITTQGDVSREPFAAIGGTGVFVSALRDALLADEIDLAVHSYKDLPTAPHDQLQVAAVPPREDARDVLVSRDRRKLADLPSGATVGTGSPRRAAQARALRPDLDVVAIRGNVDTRIRLAATGGVDAVILAAAGLARLGRLDEVSQFLDVTEMLPAPAQGALAIECRADQAELIELLGRLDDPAARAGVDAERALLATLEAGCSAPLGAHAETRNSEILLTAAVVSLDGAASVHMSATGSLADPHGLGRALASRMLAEGAAGLMGERRP